MSARPKYLLVRADFALGGEAGGDRLFYKRWRRPLEAALPGLLGCATRCTRAVVRLHEGDGPAWYTGWLRIPVLRRPGRKRLRRLKARLRERLEAGLSPIGGRVLKLGVRRQVTAFAPTLTLVRGDEPGFAQLSLFDPSGAAAGG